MTRPRIQIKEETLTARSVLDLASFEGAEVIAGEGGLGRTISNAMVMEAADIERWGRRGIFLVTSFFALEPLSLEERTRFLQRLVAVEPAGIAFKPGRLYAEAPGDVVACCDRADIPLIQLATETKYESILADVMGSALDTNLMLLNRFFSIHQQTMKLALEQPSIHVILDQAKKSIGMDCSYYGRSSGTCISTSPRAVSLENLSLKELHRGHYQTFHYYHASFDTATEQGREALAVMIPTTEGMPAYFLIHTGGRTLSQLDVMTIESFTSLLQMELLKESAIEERLFRRNNTLVHDLLLGRCTTKAATDESLKELSIESKPYYQVLLVRFQILDAKEGARVTELPHALRQRLKHQHYSVVYYESNNRIIFLRNLTSEAQGLKMSTVRGILKDMCANPDLPDFTYLATLSGIVGRYDIQRANDQVMGVYRLFDPDRGHNHLLCYEDLGIYRIFLNIEDHDKLVQFMDPHLRRLRSENPLVFGTLMALTDNNLNFQQTADQLYVHHKTVSYRVNRARESYGIDIHDSDTLAQLVIARRLLTLMGEDIPQ